MTGADRVDRAGHIGPEHRWAQAALDRATARAADPDRALAGLLAEKIGAAQSAAHPLPAPSAHPPSAPAQSGPTGAHIAESVTEAAEAEEPARWTTDRW